MSFTIEQLEALKEGATPGPWGHTSLGYEAEKYPVYGDVPGDEVALVRRQDWELVSAAPDLVDALIAEKRAHQETLHLVREPWSDVYNHGNVGRASTLRHLTRILEADNE